ncbi:hypothetical protein WA158_000213 [Blastocystis sp. Blastoise]
MDSKKCCFGPPHYHDGRGLPLISVVYSKKKAVLFRILSQRMKQSFPQVPIFEKNISTQNRSFEKTLRGIFNYVTCASIFELSVYFLSRYICDETHSECNYLMDSQHRRVLILIFCFILILAVLLFYILVLQLLHYNNCFFIRANRI